MRWLWAALILLPTGCKEQTAPKRVSSVATPSTTRASVLGEWVCIADNGGGFIGARLELKAGGTATITDKGKTRVVRYRRENGSAWSMRRQREAGIPWTLDSPPALKFDLKQQTRKLMDFERPGAEVVYFAEHGHFVDYGGNLMLHVPEVPLLYNWFTQYWCRPGDEEQVMSLMESQ